MIKELSQDTSLTKTLFFVLEPRWPACNTEKLMEGDLQDTGIAECLLILNV